MVMARLHVICGNCGSRDDFKFRIVPDGLDYGDEGTADTVVIHCRNCGTLHSLDDTIDQSDIVKRNGLEDK